MVEHVAQRWPKDEELAEILMDVKYGMPYYFEIARGLFQEMVDPEPYRKESPSAGDIIQCNMCFSEWVLFDFDLGDGLTPLRRAAMSDPTLSEFADTQFYSLFWVLEQDWKHSVSLLRDRLTHEDFLVHDKGLARNTRWAKGQLGSRLACVDGEWRFAGQVHMHDNAPSCPEPHEGWSEGKGIQDPMAFLDHVRLVLGHDGIGAYELVEQKLYDRDEPL